MAVGVVVPFTRMRTRAFAARRRPARRLNRTWLPALALAGVAAAGLPTIDHARGVAGMGDFRLCGWLNRQNCVIDGDTIRYGGAKIRLADVDAPEVFSPQYASEAALGRRATQRLVELMNAGPFRLVRAGGRDEDAYGRKLRLIERGGRSVADTLVAEGLAAVGRGAAGVVRVSLIDHSAYV